MGEDEHNKDDDDAPELEFDSGRGFPAKQLFYLALCRIAEPVALTLVYPFSYDMMKFFGGTVAQSAALYAGIFLGSFSLAEALTAFLWGALSDKIGRKPVLLLGCAGTALSMLVIGFSTNIYVAIIGRAFGGGLNGNIGIVQTMVGELVTNPKHEPRAYTIMPIFYTIGCTIGPAIGGYLGKPEESFPNSLGKIQLFKTYPYLLPNLACVVMLLLTFTIAATLLEETHPEILAHRKRRTLMEIDVPQTTAETPLLAVAIMDGTAEQPGYGTDSSSSSTFEDTRFSPKLSARIWNPIIALCILTSHTLNYIQLIPIFLQRPADTEVPTKHYWGGVGGLGLPLYKSGEIMAIGGLISMAVQLLLFPECTKVFGLIKPFAFITFLHPFVYFVAPYIAFIPEGTWREVGLFSWLIVRTIFSVFTYPILLIFIKNAAPSSSVLGRVNGIVASTGAAFRTVSPPLAGYLQTIGERNHFTVLAWWGTGMIAVAGSLQCWSIVKQFR